MSRCHSEYSLTPFSLTEEMIQNYSEDNEYGSILPGWRRFRIEYGFECSCPEGTIYVEDGPDIYERAEAIVELLKAPKPKGEATPQKD